MCAYRFEKNPINQEEIELVIDGWESGIGASPEKGVNIKNCNIESVPGTVRPNWKIDQQSVPNNSTFTYTVDVVNNLITPVGATVDLSFQAVQVTTTGTQPGGLSLNTTYWLIGRGGGNYSFATSLTNAVTNTQVTLTNAGTGVQTVSNSVIPMGTITFFANVPILFGGETSYVQFALDNLGQVWYHYQNLHWVLITGNTSTNSGTGQGQGNGLVWFQSSGTGGSVNSYLFVMGQSTVDVLLVSGLDSANLSPTWFTSWMTLRTNAFGISHFAYLAPDNFIYICDGQFIERIQENATQNFDPSNPLTYTQGFKVISLSTYSSAQCIEGLSQSIYIGDKNTNRVYVVDLTTPTTFFLISQILRVAENNIWRLLNVDNTIYCLAGTKGHVYQTTGYTFTREMKIPEYLSGGQITAWGGMDRVSGALIFGISPTTTYNSGVYKLYTTVGQFAGSVVGSLICDETPLDVNGNATNATALLTDNVPDEFYFIGCAGAIYGIDMNNKLQNYESYVESDLIPVGTALQPKAYNSIEYKLDYAPSFTGTALGVRLSWRADLQSSYTVIKDFNCQGLISDIQTPANIINTQFLQIKAELKGGSGFNTPRLRELRLR